MNYLDCSFKINGNLKKISIIEDKTLIYVIRDELGLTGTKLGGDGQAHIPVPLYLHFRLWRCEVHVLCVCARGRYMRARGGGENRLPPLRPAYDVETRLLDYTCMYDVRVHIVYSYAHK